MSLCESLTLEVFKQERALGMGFLGHNRTTPTLRHYTLVDVSFTELKSLSSELIAVLNRPARDAHSKFTQLKLLKKTGRLFWDHMLSRPVKERLKNSRSCILTLSLDEELICFPWEIIFDGEEFLCLKFGIGRLVRSRGDSGLVHYRQLPERLRMLVLADPNADLKSAYLEGLNIKNQFASRAGKVRVDFKSGGIDRKYVQKNICDYDMLHFSGHCEFDKMDMHKSGWVLSDGIFKAEEILRMGQGSGMPALVFSNACHSAGIHTGPVDSEYQKEGYSMASAFLSSGVRHYIGAIRRIEDSPSLVFAREFYAHLISGANVGGALLLSRLKLSRDFGLESLHWLNYLLYGDPGFVFLGSRGLGGKREKIRPAYKKITHKALFPALSISGTVLLLFCFIRFNPSDAYLFSRSRQEYSRGHNVFAITLGERLADRTRNFPGIYQIIADAYSRLGNKDKALEYYYKYIFESDRLGNGSQLIKAYIKLGWFYHTNLQYGKARELYDKALEMSRKLKDSANEAVALRKTAVWYIDRGELNRALGLLAKSTAINLEHPGNYERNKNLACDYFDFGQVFASKGDYEAAEQFYLRSLRMFSRLKLKEGMGYCYLNIGEVYFSRKEFYKALSYYKKGLDISEKQGHGKNIVLGYNKIGELYLEIGEASKAEYNFKRSLEFFGITGNRLLLAENNYNLGLLFKKKRRKNLSRGYLRAAQEIYRDLDYGRYLEIRNELAGMDKI
ncbi:MAG: tetratricopeptide repeat protein [Candidatus Omnitrophica bacterium]|nr:tetratricopeptide repeat protein [Candidatus Omnitrophota bacterium]